MHTLKRTTPRNFFLLIQLVILLLWSLPSAGQFRGAYTAKTFGTRDGLASADINSVMQDSEHWLWIGHKLGCSRYDGYRFTNFLFTGSQPIGSVYNITEGSNKIKWIASEKGLFWSRHNNLTYINFKEDQTTIYSVYFDQNENMWLGTAAGPVSFSPDETSNMLKGSVLSLTTHLLKNWNTSGITEDVRAITVTEKNYLYISTNDHLYYYDFNRFQSVWNNNGDIKDYVSSMYYHGHDSLYFTTSLTGLHRCIRHQYTSLEDAGHTGVAVAKAHNRIYYVNAKSIQEFSPGNNAAQYISTIPGFENKWVKGFCTDNENNFWVATNQGLELLQPKHFNLFTAKEYPQLQELYSISQLKDGSLLLGSNRGRIYRFNKEKAEPLLQNATVVKNAEVFDIFEAKEGIWFSTGYEGLTLLRNGNLQNYTIHQGLRDNTNLFFLSTSSGLYTGGDRGVTRISYNENDHQPKFTNYFFSYPRNNYTIFKTGIEAPDKTLWFGSNRGLLHFYKDSLYPASIKKLENITPSITGMQQDKQGNVWISTLGHGLLQCMFNRKNELELLEVFTARNELRSDIFLALLVDDDDNIWAASYDGLTRLSHQGNSKRYLVTFYNAEDGYINKDYQHISLLQDKTGTIWAASSNGLVNFNITNETNTAQIQLYITGVQSADSSFYLGNGMDSALKGKLNFNARNNNLSINYTAVHLSNPEDVHYLYRLSGIDSVWIDAGNESSAIYHNLPAGNYAFEVKASAGNNVWTSPARLLFEIYPPFWKRWWFISLTVLVAAMLVFYLLKRRVRTIRNIEAQKTEMQKLRAMSYEYQLEIEQVINYFATSISDQKNMDDILWDIAKNCISHLGFEDCVIYLKDEERNVLIQKAAWGPKTVETNTILNPIEIPVGKGIVGTVALTRKAEIINNTSLDDRYIVDDERRLSEIAVPIINNGQAIGVIDSENSAKDFYTERHLQILTTIASLCADKIDKVRAEQQAHEKEIEVIKLNRDLVTSQLTALRSQMNPHFIFNALNSVQQYILTGDSDEANKYLSKFSRLQREILHHCDQNFISLEKEIEMLNLYLQLEQLRFNEQFNYSVRFSDDIDPSEIKIPPMMLQPFVENAIWHGLIPKRGPKEITIDFMIKDDELIICTIKDNGIGREASARLKKSPVNNDNHKSKGISLVLDRLEILKKHYQQTFEVSISDIKDVEGKILGTSVKLIMHAAS